MAEWLEDDVEIIGGADGGRPAIARQLVPDIVSECALGIDGRVCVGKGSLGAVASHLGIESVDPVEVIERAKTATGCRTEKCAMSKLAPELPADARAIVSGDIEISYKVEGPTGSKLLTNFNIDTVLRQWAHTRPNFWPYNFNMRDYASNSFVNRAVVNRPDTLATVRFADLYARGIRRVACVINSDVYSGPGKHWMALFADATTKPPTVEFFNSSGSTPAAEWVNWMVKTRAAIDDAISGAGTKIVKVTSIRHQASRSECGVYSLFYIWARLHGVSPEYFNKTPIPDQLMFEFRQHLFADRTREVVKKFDWDKYKGTVRIEWEKPSTTR